MKHPLLTALACGMLAFGLTACGEDTTPSTTAVKTVPANATSAQDSADAVTPPQPTPTPQEAARPDAAMPAPAGEETPPVLETPLSRTDLLHRRFVLQSADGMDFTGKERPVDLEFAESPEGEGQFMVSGGICNRFTGQGSLDNGTLVVRKMAMTKMLCVDEDLNKLENGFGPLLEEGVNVIVQGNTLTLRKGDRVLVYEAADRVQ